MLERWDKYIDYLGVELLPYQDELALQLLNLPHNAKITQCRQSGKSFIMALVLYFLAVVKHWDIIITAPKVDQTWAIMKHIHKIQNKFKYATDFNNRYSISHVGRGSIICLSGSETANVEGPSAHIVVVDEHQDMVDSHVAEIFVPMLSWTDGLYWSAGIGGHPTSVAQRADVDLEWVLPYTEVVKVKPNYCRLVELARKSMLPEEFKAHYECMCLDISGHLLIPSMQTYDEVVGDVIRTTVGIDWGKRLDQSVATVVDITAEGAFIKEWIVPTGTYDEQIDILVDWLVDDVEYDFIHCDDRGVGDSSTDFLIRRIRDRLGSAEGIRGISATAQWNSDTAKLINRMSSNGTLRYNDKHETSGVFIKDVTAIEYKMMDTNTIRLPSSGQKGHSDFISSLQLAVEEPGDVYV